MSSTAIIEHIFRLYQERGHRLYGEAVTELQHALQCARLAQQAGEAPALIAACLLHDYGHLLHDLGEDAAERGLDAAHEKLGAAALAQFFPPAVTVPIRLHVAAKRFLCHQEAAYAAALSPAAQRSLQLQGGALSNTEAYEFLQTPFHAEALRLRYYDEGAKVKGAPTPPLADYRMMLTVLLRY